MAIETLEVRMTGDSSDLTKDLDKAQGKFGKFKDVVSGMVMGVGFAVAGMAIEAGKALIQFGADSVGAASDLQETLSKSEVLFGDNAKSVQAWADNAALAFGQSKQQALDAAATFATFGKAAGLTGQDLESFATDFVGLSSDLASFNNTSPEQAIQAIGAALRGESEPLRAYGVLLDDASMRQKALELGIISTTKDALTPQQKVLAAQALIYEQTSAAQGDFARTSEGLANQQRILDAQMENLKATMGQALLPVVLALVSTFNQLVQQVLPPLTAFITGRVVPAMDAIGQVISTTLGPALQAVMGWFDGFGAVVDKQTNGPLNFFRAWIDQNMPRIQKIVEMVLGAITAFWNEHGAAIVAAVQRYFGWVMQFWEMMFRTLLNIVQVFLQVLTGDWEGAGQTLQAIVRDWQTTLTSIMRQVVQAIADVWTSIDWGGIGRAIMEGIGNGLRNAAGWLADQARQAAWNALEAAKNVLGIHSPSKVAAEQIGEPFAEGIGVGMSRAIDGVTRSMNGMLAGMVGGLDSPSAAMAGASVSITQQFYGQVDGPMVRAASQDGVLAALRAAGM